MTITRYSLKALADHRWTPSVAKELVENVAHRLHLQSRACKALLDGWHPPPHKSTTTASLHEKHASVMMKKNLKHLLYVHDDTLRQCRQVAEHPHLLDRWSTADQHAVKALAEEIRSRHAPGIERWVEVAQLLSRNQQQQDDDLNGGDHASNHDEGPIHDILQRRWSIQLLCDQLVTLPRGRTAVTMGCNVEEVIRDAYTEASALCDAHWQISPDLVVVILDDETSDVPAATPPVRVTVIHPWLHHALVELFKNAAHSTLQEWSSRTGGRALSSSILPPPITARNIKASPTGDSQFVTIDVVDQGTGLGRDSEAAALAVPWAFQIGTSSSSNSSAKWDRLNVQQSYAPVRSPLNSLGMGLPASRMMMRHFGGDVTLTPRPTSHGHGDDIAGGGPGGCVARIVLPLDTTVLEPQVCVVE